ncbi:MAG: hypothetical protein H6R12_2174, partial [Proteobacteria bacterium]|nr:hypothetical protein [Pseudomonadota bacterium]
MHSPPSSFCPQDDGPATGIGYTPTLARVDRRGPISRSWGKRMKILVVDDHPL